MLIQMISQRTTLILRYLEVGNPSVNLFIQLTSQSCLFGCLVRITVVISGVNRRGVPCGGCGGASGE